MSESTLRVINAKLWYNSSIHNLGFYVNDGRITKIAKDDDLPLAERTFNAKGMLVFPGFIDTHVHLRDSDYSYKEDFLSGTSAAVAGGFTTILDMPNTSPPITNADRFVERIAHAKKKILCNVGFYASPSTVYDVVPLRKAGCIAYKVYLQNILDGNDYSSPENLGDLMKEIKSSRGILAIHAEDPLLITRGSVGEHGHPRESEIRAIGMIVRLSAETHCPVHIVHVSTSEGLEIIERAKNDGLDITAEATPQHSLLDIRSGDGNLFHSEPPLRDVSDRDAILSGLIDGSVDIIASDHAPHSLEEKIQGIKPGFPGLEITVPLMMNLASEGIVTLNRLCEAMIGKPCMRFSLKERGEIKEGYRADFVVIDKSKKMKIKADEFYSKAKYSPFDGWSVNGSVYGTFIGGLPAFLDGEIVGKPGMGSVLDGNKTSG